MHLIRRIQPFSADTTLNAVDKMNPAAVTGLWSNAANRGEAHETILINMGGHHANLLHMGR